MAKEAMQTRFTVNPPWAPSNWAPKDVSQVGMSITSDAAPLVANNGKARILIDGRYIKLDLNN